MGLVVEAGVACGELACPESLEGVETGVKAGTGVLVGKIVDVTFLFKTTLIFFVSKTV